MSASLALTTLAQDATPGYNHKIPEKIMTPDKVETRIGTLEFFDGMPTKATVEKVYDNLDLMRGVEAFLNGIPIASVEAIRLAFAGLAGEGSNKILITEQLMDSAPLFLTGNTDTVYLVGILDLKRDGATVVEVPPGTGPGTVNDAFFRFVIDMGGPGPDKGKGGKFLILPPDYQGNLDGRCRNAVEESLRAPDQVEVIVSLLDGDLIGHAVGKGHCADRCFNLVRRHDLVGNLVVVARCGVLRERRQREAGGHQRCEGCLV